MCRSGGSRLDTDWTALVAPTAAPACASSGPGAGSCIREDRRQPPGQPPLIANRTAVPAGTVRQASSVTGAVFADDRPSVGKSYPAVDTIGLFAGNNGGVAVAQRITKLGARPAAGPRRTGFTFLRALASAQSRRRTTVFRFTRIVPPAEESFEACVELSSFEGQVVLSARGPVSLPLCIGRQRPSPPKSPRPRLGGTVQHNWP